MMESNIAEIIANDISAYKGENMIAIVSGEHGCGKTCLAISLAQVLSGFRRKILLFDAAKGINNVKLQLGLHQAQDLDKVIYGGKSLNQIIISYQKGHFDVILGNAASSCLSTMSQGSLQIFGEDLNIVAQNYDITILDIDSKEPKMTDALAGMAKSVIVLSTDKVSSLTESYELVRHFVKCYPQSQINIVINYANSQKEGERAYNALKSTCIKNLGVTPKLLGIIRQDARVRDSIRAQSTIINRYPQSEAALDMVDVGKRILGLL